MTVKQKIITSNVRFPEDEWLAVKAAAADMGMSVNQYFQYLTRTHTILQATGQTNVKSQPRGLSALVEFAKRQHHGQPMGASEEDKAIYGIED